MTTLADDVELYGCLAEFVTPDELVDAARRTRAAGYQQVEAYSPFPVHGINEALGLRPSWIPRLTLIGSFIRVARDHGDEARVRRRFLARHPKSELYAGFGDFSFWRLDAVSAHLNGGFARAADLKAADVLTDISGAENLMEAEAGAVAHMNDDHADALRLYATKLLGAEDGPWRLTGLDPDGLDLARGDATVRLPFAERVTTAEQLRNVVVDLARRARAS